MASTVPAHLTKLLLDNSTKRFHINYNDYFYNHMSHGIIALSRLGASTERIQRFIDWMTPSLLSAEDHKHQGFDEEIRIVDENAAINGVQKLSTNKANAPRLSNRSQAMICEELLGKRNSYYKLLEEYHKLLNVQCGGSVEQLLCHYLPALAPGMIGGALHGILQIGYGLAVNNSWIICEGLAYQHQVYLPLNMKQNSVKSSFSVIGTGSVDIVEVFRDISRNTELQDFIAAERKTVDYEKKLDGEFMFRVTALCSKRSDDIVKYASQIKFPDYYDPQLLTAFQLDQLMSWIADSAVAVYSLTKRRNDFFLLHGVTSSWALSQIITLLANAGGHQGCEDALKILHSFLCAFIAAYIAQDAPEIENIADISVERKNGRTSWEEIIEDSLAEDMDEHVYKLIQVCFEMSKKLDKSSDHSRDEMYRCAAITALDLPLTSTVNSEE